MDERKTLMKEFSYIVGSKNGIHARPAGLLVKKALTYLSEIIVFKGEKSVNLKNLFDLLSLGIKKNDEIRIVIEGEDESEAEVEIKNFFDENFNRSCVANDSIKR
ncbi:MAG: HPr family phosphocarrier protein [Oscillospiraceae bacterium]|nr:HPr family phosphocarrier protein [Oscillospiraceae bacterium]